MTPRWTVGINGSLMWWAEGDEYGPALYPVDLGAIWDAWPKDAVIEAFDALVAAVRDQARIAKLEADADTLRQARETARLVRALQRDDCRREAILRADSLLDLLSLPEEGTE